MAFTQKKQKIAAFRMEEGQNYTGLSDRGWGGSSSAMDLDNTASSQDLAIPYEEESFSNSVDKTENNSVEGGAFQVVPDQATRSASGSWGGILKYGPAFDRLLYHMFGFEFGETALNGGSPQGSGPYTHLFELDRLDRHIVPYLTSEEADGHSANDRKNRLATLGFKRGPSDVRFPNLMARKFGFSSEAGGQVKWSEECVAYDEQRGDYSSGDWTFASGIKGHANNIMHHHCTVSLGPAGSLIDLGVRSWTVDVDFPLTEDQDTESGLYLVQPTLTEAGYTVTSSIVLSRHSADTYRGYLEGYDQLALKIVSSSGTNGFELYLPNVRIDQSSIGDEGAASETLNLIVGELGSGSNPFTTEIGSHVLVQKGPLFCITRNGNSVNEMTRE